MNKKQVEELINLAFKDVTLEDGIGLWEAQAIDDYESKNVQIDARKKDEKNDWSLFSNEELLRCDSSLSFFNANGMRFHLPAFILAEMDGKESGSIMFHLSHCAKSENFSSLTQYQREAVIFFLDWCMEQEEYEFEFPHIYKAVHEVWKI